MTITNDNGSGLPWKKINIIVGTILGLMSIVGGVIAAQKYLDGKYAEDYDIDNVMMYVNDGSEEVMELVAANQQSIQLNQYRLEQKIYQDRLDRKVDLKQEVKMRQPTTPMEHRKQQIDINEIEKDITDIERDLKNIDKGF